MFVVETQPQCLLWRHGHNVCCGDITTMFVVETQPQCLLWRHSHNVCCRYNQYYCFFLVLSLQYMMGSLSRKEVLSLLGLLLSVFLLKFMLSVFCSLFLFYLYVCNYLQFCCCILYSDHSFTLKLLIFFYKKKSIRERNFFFIDPIKY